MKDWEETFDLCFKGFLRRKSAEDKVKLFIKDLLKSEKAKMARETIDIMNKIWKQEIEKIVKEES